MTLKRLICINSMTCVVFYNSLLRAFLLVIAGGTVSFASELDSNIIKLLSTKSCIGCNLQRAELAYSDLNGCDLRGSDLTSSTIVYGDLRGCDLTGAKLNKADLSGADMSGVKLEDAELDEAKLSQVDLTMTNISPRQYLSADWKDSYGFDLSTLPIEELEHNSALFLKDGELSKAEYLLSIAIRQAPQKVELLMARALIHVKRGRSDLAIIDFSLARDRFTADGDDSSAKTASDAINTIQEASSNSRPRGSGSGYGTAVLNAGSKIVPLVMPFISKILGAGFF